VFETINDHLLIRDQEWVGSRGWPVGDCAREPECQDRRGRRAIGYDAGKTVNGRKRHALADADGRALVLRAHAASTQDCDTRTFLFGSFASVYADCE